MSNTASATAAKSTLTSTSTSARRQPQDAKGKQPAVAATDSGSGSDSESSSTEEDEDDDDDDGFSDWASSMHGALRTASLFGSHPAPASTTPAAGQDGEGEGDDDDDGLVWLDTPAEAVEYDAKVYGWDQRAVVKELGELAASPMSVAPKNNLGKERTSWIVSRAGVGSWIGEVKGTFSRSL